MTSGKVYIYTANNCYGCSVFKDSTLPSFQKWLDDNEIAYEHINMRNLSLSPDQGPHVLTKNKVEWRPAFIWVPEGEDENPSKNHVYGASWNPISRSFDLINQSYKPNLTNLSSWLSEYTTSAPRRSEVHLRPANYDGNRSGNSGGFSFKI